jgi:hypothetical protein
LLVFFIVTTAPRSPARLHSGILTGAAYRELKDVDDTTGGSHVAQALTIAPLLTVASVGSAQDASPFLGVWKVQEIAITGPRPSTISNPQPGYWVFTPGYYSIVMINSSTPRPRFEGPSEPEGPTPDQHAARYDQWSLFAAQAGSYKRQDAPIGPSLAAGI